MARNFRRFRGFASDRENFIRKNFTHNANHTLFLAYFKVLIYTVGCLASVRAMATLFMNCYCRLCIMYCLV